jgi:hypothetical protein
MVRREEQPFQSRATLLLDARSVAHRGDGPASSFEWAVSALASIGVGLARSGFALSLLDDTGEALAPAGLPLSEGLLLDALAGVGGTRNASLDAAVEQLRRGGLGGVLVAVLGGLDLEDAEQLARLRTGSTVCVGVLLDADSWAPTSARARGASAQEHEQAVRCCRASGWRVLPGQPRHDPRLDLAARRRPPVPRPRLAPLGTPREHPRPPDPRRRLRRRARQRRARPRLRRPGLAAARLLGHRGRRRCSALVRRAGLPRLLEPLGGALGLAGVRLRRVRRTHARLRRDPRQRHAALAGRHDRRRAARRRGAGAARAEPRRPRPARRARASGGIAGPVDLLGCDAAAVRRPACRCCPAVREPGGPCLPGGCWWARSLLGAAGWLGPAASPTAADAVLALGRRSSRTAGRGPSPPDPSLGRVGRRIGAARLGVAVVVPALSPAWTGDCTAGHGRQGFGGSPPTTTLQPDPPSWAGSCWAAGAGPCCC